MIGEYADDILAETGRKREWITVRWFRWWFWYKGSTSYRDIPAGFRTDTVSGAPRWMLRFLPKGWVRKYLVPASIVHDDCREDLRMSKLAGDVAFLLVLHDLKAPWILKWGAFILVCLNGSRARRNVTGEYPLDLTI
jgi:hypothetical protein